MKTITITDSPAGASSQAQPAFQAQFECNADSLTIAGIVIGALQKVPEPKPARKRRKDAGTTKATPLLS